MRVKVTLGEAIVEVEASSESYFSGLPAVSSPFDEGSALAKPMAGRETYNKRMGINARSHLTVAQPIDAAWIIDRCKDRIANKVVVEIGAGVGVLAIELAKYARHVYAIEADVAYSWEFAQTLYQDKPRNLTWIFDRAENLALDGLAGGGVIRGDVAIVVTGSDEVWLRELAQKFAPEIIMPWQDWNGGTARIALRPLGEEA